jgi:SAM-dependent methyltransferase
VKIFDEYAELYDLFYQDKEYRSEVDFVQKILDQYRKIEGKNILDLGCGTGGHALPLANLGYRVTGVDRSRHMIEQAQTKADERNLSAEFLLDDIRSVDLRRRFDAVISMFAVMGYQTSNADFFSAIQVARRHLQPDGLFIFDAWFGPAVLKQRPETRIREFSLDDKRIIRIAVPELNVLENTVLVNYTIFHLTGDRITKETREAHLMRFLFAPEVAFFARQSGFEVQKLCVVGDADRAPSDSDWNAVWVLRAV